jgi:hypothetical protein
MDLQTPSPISAHTYNHHKLTRQLPYIFDPNISSIRLLSQRATLLALRRIRKGKFKIQNKHESFCEINIHSTLEWKLDTGK